MSIAGIDIATNILAEGIWAACPPADGYALALSSSGILAKTFDPVQIEMIAGMFGQSIEALADLGISLSGHDEAAIVGGAWLIAGHDMTGSIKPNGFVVIGSDANRQLKVLHRQSTMIGAPSIIASSPRRGVNHTIVISDCPVSVLRQDNDYIQMCATTPHWRIKDVLHALNTHPRKDFILDVENTSVRSLHNWTQAFRSEGRVVESVRYACNDDLQPNTHSIAPIGRRSFG